MEGDKTKSAAQNADKTLKIRRPWRLNRRKLVKWGVIAVVAVVLSIAFIILLETPFRVFYGPGYSPKDSGPAAGVESPAPAEPSTPSPTPPRPNVVAVQPEKPPPRPSGPTVVIEVPKPIGFDASRCHRWQWKRTKRGFVFDIRCVRIINPNPHRGQ